MGRKAIDFEAIAFINETIAYASDYICNGLYRLDTKTDEATFVALFPNEKINAWGLHSFALRVDNKIYFIPANGNNISVFNIDNESIESIRLPLIEQTNKLYQRRYKFIYALVFDSYIWMIPSLYSGFIRLSLLNNEITVINDWIPDNGFFFRKTYVTLGEKLYIASRDNSNILIFDLSDEKGKIMTLGEGEGYISSMYENGDIFLLNTNGNAVKRWNVDNNTITEYVIKVDGFSGNDLFFSKIYKFGDKFYLVPNRANMMLEMDMNGNITKSEYTLFDNTDRTLFMFETQEYMYFRVKRSDRFERYKVSKKTNEFIKMEFVSDTSSSDRSKQICEYAVNNKIVFSEKNTFSLEDLIKGII